jgi:primosomal protein N' (replication factor Y) (superfamily II helicase)
VCQGKKKVFARSGNNIPLSPWAHVEISVALPVHGTFTYEVPEPLLPFIMIGKRVLVPFKQRQVTGYIMGPTTSIPTQKIKKILDVIDEEPLFPAAMAGFYKWIADYYVHPVGEVVRMAMPQGLNSYETKFYSLTPEGDAVLGGDDLSPLEALVLTRPAAGWVRPEQMIRQTQQALVPLLFSDAG